MIFSTVKAKIQIYCNLYHFMSINALRINIYFIMQKKFLYYCKLYMAKKLC